MMPAYPMVAIAAVIIATIYAEIELEITISRPARYQIRC
jgi:hypothetical protein